MYAIVFWLYLANAVLLVNHEIDSAYWREWELFKLPGGVTFFLLVHFPLVALVLYGLVLVFQQAAAGLWFSLALGIVGIFTFGIHMLFIKRGHREFRLPVSVFILAAVLAVSLAQIGFTLYLLMA